jgi:hypothetical protein
MGEPTIRILGVYQVELTDDLFQHAMEMKYDGLKLSRRQRRQAKDSVRKELSSVVLIEVVVENRDDQFDVGDFTQLGTEQAAYDEAFLSSDGALVLSRLSAPAGELLRLTFFLHFFDPAKPLVTSYGELPMPSVQKMPERLRALVPYEPVD